jgi:hypothetical protein
LASADIHLDQARPAIEHRTMSESTMFSVEASIRWRDPARRRLPGAAGYWVNVESPDAGQAPALAAAVLRTHFAERHPGLEIIILTSGDAVMSPGAQPGVIEITTRPV